MVIDINDNNLSNGARTRFDGERAAAAGRKSGAARRRQSSIRALGKTLLHTPVNITAEQLADLTRFGITEDNPELQLMMLCRLASVALYGDPQYAVPAINKLVEICGLDSRTIDNKADRKLREQELQLRREQFEEQRKALDQGALAKLDALLDGLDATARSALPEPAVAPEASGHTGGAE